MVQLHVFSKGNEDCLLLLQHAAKNVAIYIVFCIKKYGIDHRSVSIFGLRSNGVVLRDYRDALTNYFAVEFHLVHRRLEQCVQKECALFNHRILYPFYYVLKFSVPAFVSWPPQWKAVRQHFFYTLHWLFWKVVDHEKGMQNRMQNRLWILFYVVGEVKFVWQSIKTSEL